jgi:hypothetical protein
VFNYLKQRANQIMQRLSAALIYLMAALIYKPFISRCYSIRDLQAIR